jgi:hypothetical protein
MTILSKLINSNTGCHSGSTNEKTVLKILVAIANPAALDPTDKKATTGVGELESNEDKVSFSHSKPCMKLNFHTAIRQYKINHIIYILSKNPPRVCINIF